MSKQGEKFFNWDCMAYSARIPWLARIFGQRVYSEDDGYFVKGIIWKDVFYVTDNGPTGDQEGTP